MGETYYDVLDVEPTATQDELESAYRERVLETHPDHNDAPDATEQFQRVSTAREVLTDEAERAQYDRLGHDAYARSQDSGPETQAGYASTNAATTAEQQTRQETNRGRRAGQRRTRDWSFEEIRQEAEREQARSQSGSRSSSRAGSRSRSRSGSHSQHTNDTQHSKQTQHQHDQTRTTTGTTSTGPESGGSATQTDSTADADTNVDFQYAVHDWNDEVELEWQGRTLDHQTVVGLACIWLLYPAFIYASLTPTFPTSANAIVAVCTLGLVAYLLTLPRIAAGIFGSWSLLVSVALLTIEAIPIAVLSIYGFLTLAGVWVPFGYALAVWWVLRP